MAIKNIYRKSFKNYQFTSRHLTFDNLSRSNQGHITLKRLYLLNGPSYQILHETHIYNKSYMVFRFTSWHLTLALKDSGAFRPRGLLFTCWSHDVFLKSLCNFYGMTFLTSWRVFDVMLLWPHDVFFNVITYFLTSWLILTSWRTSLRHDKLFTYLDVIM